jgi:hypothetical protein
MMWRNKMFHYKTSHYMGNNLIIGSTQEPGDNFVVPITSPDGPFLDCKLISLN